MMAAVILVCSLVSLLLFFLSYCRSLVASSAKEALPIEVVEVTGISQPASPDDFSRVIQLLKLCPDRPEERGQLRAIGAYYRFLGLLRATLAAAVPSLKEWTDNERAHCSYFAALVLGRRIAFSRDLLAQQMMP